MLFFLAVGYLAAFASQLAVYTLLVVILASLRVERTGMLVWRPIYQAFSAQATNTTTKQLPANIRLLQNNWNLLS